MTTLRDAATQALETLKQLNASLHLFDCYKAFDAEITTLNAALEQHDEDVAYMTDRYNNWRLQKELVEKARQQSIVERIPPEESDAEFQVQVEQTMCQEPRREWQGLKQWEINDGIDQIHAEDVCSWSFRQGVYFAEKALKEKNYD